MIGILLLAGVIGHTYPADEGARALPTVYSWPQASPTNPELVSPAELKAKLEGKAKVVLLDARPAADFAAGHIRGALNLPPSQFDAWYPVIRPSFKDLPDDAELVIYCGPASRGDDERLYELLTARGHKSVKLLAGGWSAWVAAGYPQEAGR